MLAAPGLMLIKTCHPNISNLDWLENRPVTMRTQQVFDLRCRTCGSNGELWLSSNDRHGWSFSSIGFVGLAVNRHNPPNSVMRCNSCGSPQVRIEFARNTPD